MSMHPDAIYEVVARHRDLLFERASWREKSPVPRPSADGPWSEFGDERRFLNHRRRVMIAKFNPKWWGNGGDPSEPDLWRPGHAESWLCDAYGARQGKPVNSSAALRAIRAGDLIVPMRIEGGERRLLGVWLAILVNRWIDPLSPMRELWPGRRARVATEVWHVPLVRFNRDVIVSVVRGRDAELDSDRGFTVPNESVVEVADPDGGRTAAARLLAACSLPGELLTCADPLALQPRLAANRTGMRSEDYRYWKDMQYKHLLRCAAEDAAVARSRAKMLERGYEFPDCWDHQGEGGWGGDYECWPTTAARERMAIEVKGTSKRKWLGNVRLEQSQYERALRHASALPRPKEVGYGWEVHIQPDIPNALNLDLGDLPDLEVRSSIFVRDQWPSSCISRRSTNSLVPARGLATAFPK